MAAAASASAGPDHLFNMRNYFYLGAYQAAINCSDSLPSLSPDESIEKDCLVFRSYVALGSYPVRISSIFHFEVSGKDFGVRFDDLCDDLHMHSS